MRYATTDAMMGIGNYVGEIRQGPDGQLYEWVQGVDGLGNPIGRWRLPKIAQKLVSVAKQAAGGPLKLLSRFIPPPIKGIAKRVCNFLPQVGPVVALVPEAARPYKMANKFCGVLRDANIAGPEDMVTQVPGLPNLSHLVPAPVRTTAKAVCGIVDRLSPIIKFVPPVRPYAAGASTICRILQKTGIAGTDGLMEAPDGRLYEVVEGIGEFGERRKFLRAVPVNIIFPAYIKRRGRRGVRPGARPGALRAAALPPRVARLAPVLPQPVLAPPAGAPVMPVAAPAPFRRFR